MGGHIKDVAGLIKFIRNRGNTFDRVLDKLNIVSVGGGKCSAELKVDETHTNPMGGLHGGFSTTLVDDMSSFALMSQVPTMHVSVDIHVSFLKGARIGDDLLIEADTVKQGKSLVFLEVLIKNKATGDLLVKGSHTKFVLDTKMPV